MQDHVSSSCFTDDHSSACTFENDDHDFLRLSLMPVNHTAGISSPPLHPSLHGMHDIDYEAIDADTSAWWSLITSDDNPVEFEGPQRMYDDSIASLPCSNDDSCSANDRNQLPANSNLHDPAEHTRIPKGIYGGWYYHVNTKPEHRRDIAEKCAPIWRYDMNSRYGQNSMWKRLVKKITPEYAAAILNAKEGDDIILQIASVTQPRTLDPQYLQIRAHNKEINDGKMKKTAKGKYTRLAKIKSKEEGISLEEAFNIVSANYKPQPNRGLNNNRRGP